MRYAAYVSGNATRLIRYLEQYQDKMINLIAVLHDGSESNPSLEARLRDLEIPYRHVHLNKLTGKSAGETTSTALLALLKKHGIDYCFCFGSRILQGRLLIDFENRIINFHPSLLPQFPGVRAIDKAIESGAYLLGNTAHFIDVGVDTGPIIMQSALPASHFSHYDDVLDLQLDMLQQIAQWLDQGRVSVNGNVVYVRDAKPIAGYFPPLEFK
jgi:phosphoribosylglycinamide formyltransferase-1